MRALVIALVAGLAAECSRTPPEDFPRNPASSSAATTAAPSAGTPQAPAPPADHSAPPEDAANGRCVVPSPSTAPPPVAPGPAPGCPADPEGGPAKVPVVRVAFPDAGTTAVEAELVSSEHDTTRGLMYRKSMPEGHGMLFRLAERREQQFWMHNTCIPLDLLYIDEDGLLVGIVENAPTLNDDPRGVACPSRYVLEVNAGWSRKHGVKAGQHVTLPREARSAGG